MEKSFLQSLEWQKFQEAIGRKCFRFDDVLFIRMALPRNKTYLYCPRSNIDRQKAEKLIEKIKSSINASDLFIRFEPINELQLIDSFKSPTTQPKTTTVLDLNLTTDELLAAMKPKTRYNINLAQKKGVKTKICQKVSDQEFKQFWQLMKKTSKRDSFSLHPENYYYKMLEVLGKKDICHLVQAYFQDQLIAVIILLTFEKEAAYLHGGSDKEYKNLMAPYLAHWQAIQFAKKQNFQRYDFWGIRLKPGQDLTDTSKLEGVTRFKLSFGGQVKTYPTALEVPLNKIQYYGYRTLRQVNRLFKPRTF